MLERTRWIGDLSLPAAITIGVLDGFAIWVALTPSAPSVPLRVEILVRGTAALIAIAIPVIARLEVAEGRLEDLGRAEP